MKQNLTAPSLLPADSTHRDTAEVGMGRADEPVLILLRHCRDMKRQEARLRLVTLLLLLCCVGLFVLNIYDRSRQQTQSGSSGPASSSLQSPAYSKQGCVCPTGDPPTEEILYIRNSSVGDDNLVDGRYVTWKIVGGTNIQEIVIPRKGFYFVSLRVILSCQRFTDNFTKFKLEVHNVEKGYDSFIQLLKARDGLACNTADGEGDRMINIVEGFNLSQGDKLKVWITKGYELIQVVELSAYLIS